MRKTQGGRCEEVGRGRRTGISVTGCGGACYGDAIRVDGGGGMAGEDSAR